ncbi:hypothetical protein ABW03_11425 [Bacillus altitudinis]|nr:hypothetical protein ABW03_11425 [Bacillus altitudinis]
MYSTNVLNQKKYILLFLFSSILTYSLIYQHVDTGINSVVNDILKASGADMNSLESEGLRKIELILTSVYFQLPMQFITSLINLYAIGILYYIFNKIVNIFKVKKVEVTYSGIVDILYLGLYIQVIDLLVQSIIMLSSNTSLDFYQNSWSSLYWLYFTLIQTSLILTFFKKKYNILYSPAIFFVVLISIQCIIRFGDLF